MISKLRSCVEAENFAGILCFQNMRNLHVWHAGTTRSIFVRFCSGKKHCLSQAVYFNISTGNFLPNYPFNVTRQRDFGRRIQTDKWNLSSVKLNPNYRNGVPSIRFLKLCLHVTVACYSFVSISIFVPYKLDFLIKNRC